MPKVAASTLLRPPGAVAEQEFLALCVQCGQCAHTCPYGAISMTGDTHTGRHTPVVDPRVVPCWLCMKCPPQCPAGALDGKVTQPAKAHMGRAVILKDRCHNYTGGIMCWTCYDRCPLRGTAIILQAGLTPTITDACVGCGVCEYVCPVRGVVTVARGNSHGR
ncbi:MAG: 4Fe-4S dicluster domain-containing protein [Desulfovibrionaceae bacterium]